MAFAHFLKQAKKSALELKAAAKEFADKPETREAIEKAVKGTQDLTRRARELRDDYRKPPASLKEADDVQRQIDLENSQYMRAMIAFDLECAQLAARRLADDDESAIYDAYKSKVETIRARGSALERRRIELADDRALLDKRMEVLAGQVAELQSVMTSRRSDLETANDLMRDANAALAKFDAATPPREAPAERPPFVLGSPWKPFRNSVYVATATGDFARKNHAASPPPGARMFMSFDDLFKSVMITGSTGSGKTTCAYYPLIAQLVANNCGGLVFAQKAAAVDELRWLIEGFGRKVRVVGIGGDLGLNILKGWDPIKASEAIGDYLDREAGDKSVWLGIAKARVQNCLFILRMVPSEYTFTGMARYIFNRDYAERIESLASKAAAQSMADAATARAAGDVKLARNLEDKAKDFEVSLDWERVEWDGLEQQMRDDTQGHLVSFMPMFKRSTMARAWCGADPTLEEVDLTQCLDGEIFIVSSGMEEWGQVANFALAMVKRRWFDMVISRSAKEEVKPLRPLFIGLDEYQDFADTHDGDLLGLLRQYRHITIAATQGYTSIYEAISSEKSARKIILNFVTQIALSSTDTEGTIKHFESLFGKTEQWRISHSSQKGGGSGYNTGSSDGGQAGSTSRGKSENKSFSKSSSAQQAQIELVSPQTFHSLTKAAKNRATGQINYPTAIATIAIGEHQLSDVVNLEKPMFPPNG